MPAYRPARGNTYKDLGRSKPFVTRKRTPLSFSCFLFLKVLYQNVAAGLVDLNWQPDVGKYKLSDAIRHSITTKGCILRKKLDSKDPLGDQTTEKYLRVTLGASAGQSPGIPYVLELWPAGNKSPIHNHGNAYAIIKVLHGGLTIKEFNKLKKVGNSCPV